MTQPEANGDDDEARWSDAWRYVEPQVKAPSGPRELRQLLHRYGLHARKGLGQNFLVDEGILARIVSSADLQPDDTVVEVGPGLGTLTRQLAERAGRVVSVEIDPGLTRALREIVADKPNVQV